MQLIAIPRFRISSSVFNPSLSAVLSGTTAVGAISAAIYNIDSASTSIGSSLQSLLSIPGVKHLLDGFNGLGKKFHDWGSAIVGSKDALANWIKQYLNIHGLKAGVAQLYQKLKDWFDIVYNWFATKFLKFIENIPEMVRNWKDLRLSLFKWGTFLGGGGGAALFAIFASGENWGKLQDLMARGDFEEIMGDLGKLMEQNSDAFKKMGPEKVQEILEKFLNEPDEAKAATKELLERQEERKKDKQNENEELSEQEIEEEFSSAGGGNPQTPREAFGKTVAGGLSRLVDLFKKNKGQQSFGDQSPRWDAYQGIKEYIEKIEAGAKKDEERGKGETSKVKFTKAIKDNRLGFMIQLSEVAEKAYEKLKTKQPLKVDQEELAKEFMAEFQNRFTEPAKDGKGNLELDAKLFMKRPK